MDDAAALQRTIAFDRGIVERTSTRLIAFRWGTAYLNDGFRERWDSNLLWVDTTEGADAPDLVDAADRILGGVGLLHREIRVNDDAAGASLAPGLRAAGYGCERLVVMRRRLGAEMADDPGPTVEEVDLGGLRPTLEIIIRREPYGASEESVRMLADFRNELVRHASARFFCTWVNGEIASVCELYRDGEVAQIEDVNTLQEFRNRGLARAVVRRAADVAVAAGAPLVFLHALDDDWPKHLYAKVGFEPIGHVWSFVRPSAPLAKSPA